MHSGRLEKTASLKKRSLSRGMSEDESLRQIIREADENNRHLNRSDSRTARGKTSDSQSEEELIAEDIEMEELRQCYKETLHDVRSLELQQGALMFQVECLQDVLEGAEEVLAETQRENQLLSAELERERQQRGRLEEAIASLMQEVERLREERQAEQSLSTDSRAVWLQGAREGTSVDREDENPLTCGHEGPDDFDESSGYEDAPSEFAPTPSTPDSITVDGVPVSGPSDSCSLC